MEKGLFLFSESLLNTSQYSIAVPYHAVQH